MKDEKLIPFPLATYKKRCKKLPPILPICVNLQAMQGQNNRPKMEVSNPNRSHYDSIGKRDVSEKNFLENISKAIDLYLYPSRVVPAGPIEKKGGWETFLGAKGLKLILAIDYSIFDLPLLMKHYKEYPSQNQTLLGDTPFYAPRSYSLF